MTTAGLFLAFSLALTLTYVSYDFSGWFNYALNGSAIALVVSGMYYFLTRYTK